MSRKSSNHNRALKLAELIEYYETCNRMYEIHNIIVRYHLGIVDSLRSCVDSTRNQIFLIKYPNPLISCLGSKCLIEDSDKLCRVFNPLQPTVVAWILYEFGVTQKLVHCLPLLLTWWLIMSYPFVILASVIVAHGISASPLKFGHLTSSKKCKKLFKYSI